MGLVETTISLDDNKYYKRLYAEAVKDREYNPDKVVIAREVARIIGKRLVPYNALYRIDLKEGYRGLFINPVGGGKTFSLRGIFERMYLSKNYFVILLTDVKNEFHSSSRPAPKKQGHDYLVGESPRGFPIIAYKPKFFSFHNIDVPKGQRWFGFKMSDLDEADFKDLLGYDNLPPVQQKVIYSFIQKVIRSRSKEYTVEDLVEFIQGHDAIDKQSRATLELKLAPVIDGGFFSPPYIDWVGLLNSGWIPTLNLEYYEKFGANNTILLSTINIIRRIIVNARKKGLLKKRVCMIVDEAHVFLAKQLRSFAKEDVLTSYKVDRRYRVDYWSVFQVLSEIEEVIFTNSKYVFISSDGDIEDFVVLYKKFGFARGAAVSLRPKISKIVTQMRRVPFTWMLFSKSESEPKILRFLPPMSKHTTSS